MQLESSGGKPPGAGSRTLLASDGSLSVTRDQTSIAQASRPQNESTCDTVVPVATIDAITNAIASATLEPGLPAETHNGSLNSSRILTIDDQPYAVPSTPAFTAAVDAALKAADLCPKPH